MTTSSFRHYTRLGLWLVGATLAYNVIEAGVALWAGLVAHSIALLGFGLDSVIECAAAAVLLWRLAVEARGAEEEAVEHAERRVHRFVGATFFLLACYVIVISTRTLLGQREPAESIVGMILAGVSLIVMPIIAWGKLRVAEKLGSAALRAEAKETLACSYLSFTLLLGLAANAIFGWGWADPVAALLMVPWLIKEGLEGVRGECDCENNNCL